MRLGTAGLVIGRESSREQLVAELHEHGPVLLAAAEFVITILSYPVVALAQTILYYDLRIRAEGYDVQLMSDRLASQPAPASGIAV